MISTSKICRAVFGGILSLLGLVTMLQVGGLASAESEKQTLPCEIQDGYNAMRAEQESKEGSRLISGEVLSMDGTKYVVKDETGKEVRFQIDEETDKTPINQGDRITANIDNQDHAVWIRSNKSTDRRTEHASTDCEPK